MKFYVKISLCILLCSESIISNAQQKKLNSFITIFDQKTDSINKRIIVDSVSRRLVGSWQLIQSNWGFVWAHPYQAIKMKIEPDGKGYIYLNNNHVTQFDIEVITRGIYFDQIITNQNGKSFFRIRPGYRGGLRWSGNRLFIHENRSEGQGYVFTRIE